MNLGKIKELEDVKNELQIIGAKHSELLKQKKSKYIMSAYNDFKEFLKENGFIINETSQEIEANYGSMKVKIDKVKIEDSFIGAYSVWNLKCSRDKSSYRILLNELGYYPAFKSSFGSSRELSEEEKLNQEIEKTKENIKKMKMRIEEIDTVKWGYGLIDENYNIRNDKYPQFESMKELLNSIFN